MKTEQSKALRPYFHGLTDEQFTEMISEWPLNNISKGMDDYALCVAKQAVKGNHKEWVHPANMVMAQRVGKKILSRIKQLTNG